MAQTEYYTGDTIPLKFTITDADGAVNPSQVKVTIQKPDKSHEDEEDATILGNEVSYIIPISVTDISGVYIAYFVCTLPGSQIRTHMMQASVVDNPR